MSERDAASEYPKFRTLVQQPRETLPEGLLANGSAEDEGRNSIFPKVSNAFIGVAFTGSW